MARYGVDGHFGQDIGKLGVPIILHIQGHGVRQQRLKMGGGAIRRIEQIEALLFGHLQVELQALDLVQQPVGGGGTLLGAGEVALLDGDARAEELDGGQLVTLAQHGLEIAADILDLTLQLVTAPVGFLHCD